MVDKDITGQMRSERVVSEIRALYRDENDLLRTVLNVSTISRTLNASNGISKRLRTSLRLGGWHPKKHRSQSEWSIASCVNLDEKGD